MKAVFDSLRKVIVNYLLEQTISADKALELDNQVIDSDVNIPIEALKNVVKLYEKGLY